MKNYKTNVNLSNMFVKNMHSCNIAFSPSWLPDEIWSPLEEARPNEISFALMEYKNCTG